MVIYIHTSAGQTYTLIEWEDDNSLSAVLSSRIINEAWRVGGTAHVKSSGRVYREVIKEVGMLMSIFCHTGSRNSYI